MRFCRATGDDEDLRAASSWSPPDGRGSVRDLCRPAVGGADISSVLAVSVFDPLPRDRCANSGASTGRRSRFVERYVGVPDSAAVPCGAGAGAGARAGAGCWCGVHASAGQSTQGSGLPVTMAQDAAGVRSEPADAACRSPSRLTPGGGTRAAAPPADRRTSSSPAARRGLARGRAGTRRATRREGIARREGERLACATTAPAARPARRKDTP